MPRRATPNLEPWIQWVTVHSGSVYRDHGIYHLGDGHKLEDQAGLGPAVRRGPQGLGLRQHEHPLRPTDQRHVLPDRGPRGPIRSRRLFDSVLPIRAAATCRNTPSDRVRLGTADYLRFVSFMASPRTLAGRRRRTIASSSATSAAAAKGWKRARRSSTGCSSTCSRWYYRKERPRLLHVLPQQHRALAAHALAQHGSGAVQAKADDPGAARIPARDPLRLPDDGPARRPDAARWPGPTSTVVMMSALSQQPCLPTRTAAARRSIGRASSSGCSSTPASAPYRVEPVMSEQFHVHFDSDAAAREAATRAQGLQVEGQPAMDVKGTGASVFAGCPCSASCDPEVPAGSGGGEPRPFFDALLSGGGHQERHAPSRRNPVDPRSPRGRIANTAPRCRCATSRPRCCRRSGSPRRPT